MEGHERKFIGILVMLEDRNLKCDHAIISTWSIAGRGHELIFLAMSGLRKEFGIILTVATNFNVQYTYGIASIYNSILFILITEKKNHYIWWYAALKLACHYLK